MRAEGRISDDEFDELTAGTHRIEVPRTDPDEPDVVGSPLTDDADDGPHSSLGLRQDMGVGYLGAVFLASTALVVVGWAGVLSWWVIIPAILVLVMNLLDGWRKPTLVGVVVVTILLIVDLAASTPSTTQVVGAAPTTPSTVPLSPPVGSLGIYMEDIIAAWNQVEDAPQIVRGLTRQNEIGDYDTFIYRFGQWGRLAGAYDPDDDAIYALLVAGQLSDEATDGLYLHLCFVVSPYSQDCIDTYHEQGLDGGDLADLSGVSRNVEWRLEDQTWRLEIDQNVLTIRVFGADAA
jgi:hypothetical protein